MHSQMFALRQAIAKPINGPNRNRKRIVMSLNIGYPKDESRDIQMKEKKRSVGRPRTGKIKILVSFSPALVQAIDDQASISNMSRSEFIGMILARALEKKE